MSARYSVSGRIAIIRIDNPPINSLGHATREGVVRKLRRAIDSADIEAIVLTGREGFFSAGADISEFGTPKSAADPVLGSVIAALEEADKPIVAAIDGNCLGGGLELALGAHYRIATSASKIGLPEVNLGLVPGAGGTQRLPRVVGAEVAADIIIGGRPRTAGDLVGIEGQRLLDRVVDTDLVRAATDFATEIAAVRPLPRVRDRNVEADERNAISTLREGLRRRSRGFLAPLAALDLVEKAITVPFEEGLAEERRTFLELVSGEQSAALRHVFFAERAARKIPDVPRDTSARTVDTVAVIGAGTMGGGIAMNFINAGIPVTILDSSQEGLDRGLGVILRNYQTRVDKGKLAPELLAHRMALLTPSLDYADVSDSDLVIEAAFEDIDVKRSVFSRLDEVAKPGAILASNTSTLDIDAIAAVTGRPRDVLGMHFFSPANVMKLLEIVRGKETADDVVVTAMAVGQRVGKVGVIARVCDGFIGNRMLAKYRDAAMDLLYAGATPVEIDSAVEGFGFAMGPFRMGDLAGNDIGWAVRKRRYAEQPDMPRDEIADALCESGRFGQKTGGGWYDYQPGSRDAIPSPVVDDLLAAFLEKRGTARRKYEPDEIVRRLVFALVDEGARILDEGIALRASDIDVVYVAGYGFPRYRGGPMYYADTVGLANVLSALRRFHGDDSWEPAPSLVRLATEARTFN
ncbi:3-hydroxyacyl-CoA dehydrogenase NAD-binding domain-containing protein [Amycolatopsis acidiphila]|uniref:3-hydroxyacyl-CoA dehydrogenase n=1 Tax=Amycolatopsis acidiphila TaxID=715473 RepID=A0A558AI48_9PSEU|nr:3-hydroxyacyl-CoA dehydrogenase NAD-binding domain-containing protein [Amycolatopsis acidiphila]TVT23909.1 3-hydroxyacyl-CoA dehydrogenase [Amycolatopsis acidiphila]UIJ61114.1 3-hydroxyacyl-CoA dehydrogenase NAD-binding domain-containing protein [Amycolatopsis acidiphila]GHG86663.1 fatty acid degradation protein [Amycolatopsis acidiphila]